MKQHPPRQIFEKLANKNAIKCKIGGPPPLAIFPETLDPPRDFGKNFKYPHPGFLTRVHLCRLVHHLRPKLYFSSFIRDKQGREQNKKKDVLLTFEIQN
jgi:hypothetical protein